MKRIIFKITSLSLIIMLMLSMSLIASADNITYLDLSANKTFFVKGETDTIKVFYQALNGSTYSATTVANSECTFQTTNPNAFTVNASGVITAVKSGRAMITVTHSESGISNKYMVVCAESADNIESSSDRTYGATTGTVNKTATDPSGYERTVGKISKGGWYVERLWAQDRVLSFWFYDEDATSVKSLEIRYSGVNAFPSLQLSNDGNYSFKLSSNFTQVAGFSSPGLQRKKGWHQFSIIVDCRENSNTQYSVYVDNVILNKYTVSATNDLNLVYNNSNSTTWYTTEPHIALYDETNLPGMPAGVTTLKELDLSEIVTSFNLEEGKKNMGTVKGLYQETVASYPDIDGVMQPGSVNEITKEVETTLSFVSDNESVCTVDSTGDLTPVSAGVSNITISTEGVSKSVKVLVKPAPVTKKALNISEITNEFEMKSDGTSVGKLLADGKKIYEETRIVRPEYNFGDGYKADEETISSSSPSDVTSSVAYSSDSDKITVDASGNISATEPGLTNIKISYNGLSVTVKVLVKPARIITKKLDVSEVTKNFFGTGNVGKVYLITTTTFPEHEGFEGTVSETITPVRDEITPTYTSKNTAVFTVTASGNVTVVNSGTADIEIAYDGLTENIAVECYSQADMDSIVSTLQKSEITIDEVRNTVSALGLDLSDITNTTYVYDYLKANNAQYKSETTFTAITEKFANTLTSAKNNVKALETSLETAKNYLETNKTALGIDGLKAYTYFKSASEDIQKRIIDNVKKVGSDSEIKDVLNNNAVKDSLNALTNYSQVYGVLDTFKEELGIDFTAYNVLIPANQALVQDGILKARSEFTDNASIKNKFDALVSSYSGGGSGAGSGTGGNYSGSSVSNSSSSSNSGSITGTLSDDKTDNKPYELPQWVQEEKEAEIKAENVFSDLHHAEWARDVIKDLYTKNIISGYPDGTFGVNNNITREEIVKLLVVAGNLKSKGTDEVSFSDVNPSAWYYEYVKIAVENGIVNGIGNNSFGVGKFITREEMAAMLYRLCQTTDIMLDEQLTVFPFNDQDEISTWADYEIKVLRESYLIDGYAGNVFKPKDNLTRAQAAKLIYGYVHYND